MYMRLKQTSESRKCQKTILIYNTVLRYLDIYELLIIAYFRTDIQLYAVDPITNALADSDLLMK